MQGGIKNVMKYNHWIPKLLKVNAIVLFQTIYFAMTKNLVTERLIRHEKKHIEQQKKEGSIKFKIKYFLEYLKNLAKYRNHHRAYYYISYEIEARKAEVEYNG